MAGDEEGSGVPAWLNGIVVAQSIVGVVSALLALNILVTLKVHSYLRFVQYRAVFGVMVGNLFFSLINIIPVAYDNYALFRLLGHLIVRALWLSSTFVTASYEILMLVVAVSALRTRQGLTWPVEAVGHGVCASAGVVSFAGVAGKGYLVLDSYGLVHARTLTNTTARRFQHEYDSVVSDALVVWLCMLGVSMVTWIGLMVAIRRKQKAIDSTRQDIARGLDEFVRQKQFSLINWFERSVVDIARPLTAYCVVYLVFAVPHVVLLTNYCRLSPMNGSQCQLPCALILSLRTLASCAVFLRCREDRERTLAWRQLWLRVRILPRRATSGHGGDGNRVPRSRLMPSYTPLDSVDQVSVAVAASPKTKRQGSGRRRVQFDPTVQERTLEAQASFDTPDTASSTAAEPSDPSDNSSTATS